MTDQEINHSVFHAGYNETLLFSSLVITSHSQLAAACVVVGILGVVFEGLKLFLARLQVISVTRPLVAAHKIALLGALQMGTYVLYLFLSYCLMLIFMALNAWLCVSLLCGAGLGHLLFHFQPLHNILFCQRKKNSVDEEETKSEATTIYGSSGHKSDDEFILNSLSNAKK